MDISIKKINGTPVKKLQITKINGNPVVQPQVKVKSITKSITDGPNRDRLFDALKYAHDRSSKIDLGFAIAMDEDRLVKTSGFRVLSLEHEDGSGHSFNLKGDGYCSPLRVDEKAILLYCHWRAYYNARRREGTITINFDD